MGMDIDRISKQVGYSTDDLTNGLQRAIDEFLEAADGRDWQVHKVYKNNNGLTILKRNTKAMIL